MSGRWADSSRQLAVGSWQLKEPPSETFDLLKLVTLVGKFEPQRHRDTAKDNFKSQI
jgi:hypothetical protein